jgi:hypothetical protein
VLRRNVRVLDEQLKRRPLCELPRIRQSPGHAHAQGASAPSTDVRSHATHLHTSSRQSFFGFGATVNVGIALENESDRLKTSIKDVAGNTLVMPLLTADDTMSGTVTLDLKGGKAVEHVGVYLELIGQTELVYDRTNSVEFMSLQRELGTLTTASRRRRGHTRVLYV